MSKFSNLIAILISDPKITSSLTPELSKKIQSADSFQQHNQRLQFLLEVLEFADSRSLHIPEIFNLLFENIDNFFSLDNDSVKIVLDSLLFWQDWKMGVQLLDKITISTQLNQTQWLLLAEFNFKLGFLCYNLFKGSNYALTLMFFEKTLNYLSKSNTDKKVLLILSSTVWFIGQIEYEIGYSIKASDYQLSSIYYQNNFSDDEFKEYFKTDKANTRNTFILSSFQAATDYFIACKVASQSYSEYSKNYLYQSYSYIKRILRIINNQTDYAILEQIRLFLLQVHSVIDKEGFILNHSCDTNILSSKVLISNEFINYIDSHISLLEDSDKKIIWLAVLDQGGLVLFEYDFEENKISSKNTLYSSFIHVISKWGQVELESGPAKEINFLGNSFIVELDESIEVIAVVSKPSPEFHYAIRNLALNFNKAFKHVLESEWNGNIKIFESKGLQFIDLLKESLFSTNG